MNTAVWLVAAPFTAAAMALTGVWLTARQKEGSDRRAEWWRRTTWALERTADPDDTVATVAVAVLTSMRRSPLATASEQDLIETIALAQLPTDEDDGDCDDDNDSES